MSSMEIDDVRHLLQGIGYHAAVIQPLLPMYLHLILSALFPIITGAHASLSRPSSAAKPPKTSNKRAEDGDDDFEGDQKMEGLSPMDAVLFPVMGGLTLAGLYYVIKYLDDPTILNMIMNWYFAIFGLLALARLLTDAMSVLWSFIFPKTYQLGGEIWKVDQEARRVCVTQKTQLEQDSPLPGRLALLPLPPTVIQYLWAIRRIPTHKLQIHAYVHNNFKADFRIGPFGLTSFVIAVAVELYFNLIDKPWWLTNLLGFSFSYAALQIMSPTTAWTGTLILGGLFFYDIYFVFFTPMMVTVATKIDIPAKLLFPRPEAEGMSMLGLGDVVLPGMMIGFALRFDLFLFYLRKQTVSQKPAAQSRSTGSSKEEDVPEEATGDKDVVRATWVPAAGGWGERFWNMGTSQRAISEQGGNFPKTYFYASVGGYVLGLMVTLGVMQVFEHAQPALLYLVPGVLGALWGTALFRGETSTLWNFNEDGHESADIEEKKRKGESAGTSATPDWMDWFIIGRMSKKMEKEMEKVATEEKSANADKSIVDDPAKETEDEVETSKNSQDAGKGKALPMQWDGKLVSFSISLPQPSKDEQI